MSLVKDQLDIVYREMKEVFRQQFDHVAFGINTYWSDKNEIRSVAHAGFLPEGCEDFAIACRHRCDELNLHTRLGICLTEIGEGHLVLECEGWILDNRKEWVMRRENVPYHWISFSGYKRGGAWCEMNY